MCLIENKKTKEVLTINRVKDWCGVAFPGGHIEEGEPIVLSVIREIKEETNLDIDNLIFFITEAGIILMRESGEKKIFIALDDIKDNINKEHYLAYLFN